MKTSSAKAKGRKLQQYVRDRILEYFKELTSDDCSSRSMGASGEDILLSQAARNQIPISVECKSNAKHHVYSLYEQAKTNAGSFNPVLVIKQNADKPLAVIDLEYFLKLVSNQKAA